MCDIVVVPFHTIRKAFDGLQAALAWDSVMLFGTDEATARQKRNRAAAAREAARYADESSDSESQLKKKKKGKKLTHFQKV